jgi:3-phosphoglycerate kinase
VIQKKYLTIKIDKNIPGDGNKLYSKKLISTSDPTIQKIGE